MQKNYLISVTTQQILAEDETDKIELITDGNYTMKNGHRYIIYKEYSDDNPSQQSSTFIKIEKNESSEQTVTISRRGAMRSDLILEQGKRHQCHYDTPLGSLIMGIYTAKIDNRLNNDGGTLTLEYDLDYNSDFISKNTCVITVKPNASHNSLSTQ